MDKHIQSAKCCGRLRDQAFDLLLIGQVAPWARAWMPRLENSLAACWASVADLCRNRSPLRSRGGPERQPRASPSSGDRVTGDQGDSRRLHGRGPSDSREQLSLTLARRRNGQRYQDPSAMVQARCRAATYGRASEFEHERLRVRNVRAAHWPVRSQRRYRRWTSPTLRRADQRYLDFRGVSMLPKRC